MTGSSPSTRPPVETKGQRTRSRTERLEEAGRKIREEDSKLRRLLKSRGELKTLRTFTDAAGGQHKVRSVPVVGGRFLYDDSRRWGLRALGFVGGGLLEGPAGAYLEGAPHAKALVNDYVTRCSGETHAICRRVKRADLPRVRSPLSADGTGAVE